MNEHHAADAILLELRLQVLQIHGVQQVIDHVLDCTSARAVLVVSTRSGCVSTVVFRRTRARFGDLRRRERVHRLRGRSLALHLHCDAVVCACSEVRSERREVMWVRSRSLARRNSWAGTVSRPAGRSASPPAPQHAVAAAVHFGAVGTPLEWCLPRCNTGCQPGRCPNQPLVRLGGPSLPRPLPPAASPIWPRQLPRHGARDHAEPRPAG